ncbi:4799_t:CDS:1, partial [Dentiscutata erythropus]
THGAAQAYKIGNYYLLCILFVVKNINIKNLFSKNQSSVNQNLATSLTIAAVASISTVTTSDNNNDKSEILSLSHLGKHVCR